MKKTFIKITLALGLALSIGINTIPAFAETQGEIPGMPSDGAIPNSMQQVQAPIQGIQSKKLIISEVTTDPAFIEPGKEFTLNFKIQNKSSNKLENIALSILGIEGKNVLEGFSPVGTTNEIYYGGLNKGGTGEISLKLIGSPSIKSGIYNFNINCSFNESGSSPVEINKVCGIIVKNTSNMMITEFKPLENGNVTGSFLNAGKGSLNNVMVNITAGDKNISKYIGAMEAEVEESFDEALGSFESDTSGNVVISFNDEMGIENKIEKPFTIKGTNIVTASKPASEKKWSFKSVFKKLFGLGS